MPLTKSWSDPTGGTIDAPYIYCAESNFNHAQGVGRLVFHVHRDEASAYAGKAPVDVVAIDIPSVSVVGSVPSLADLVAANQAEFAALASVVYTLALSRPEFSGATLI